MKVNIGDIMDQSTELLQSSARGERERAAQWNRNARRRQAAPSGEKSIREIQVRYGMVQVGGVCDQGDAG